jgi:probable HAF family extracellular repeat protein
MARHLLSLALAIPLTVSQHSITATKPDSNITDLGSLSRNASQAFGINNDPATVDVVGYSATASGVPHGFFWTTPGPMVDLGALDGCESFAWDINNHRQIAGRSTDASRHRWAVVWTSVDGRWTLEKLPTLRAGDSAEAFGINNGIGGDPATVAIVGVSAGRAAMWMHSAKGWTVRDLGTLPEDTVGFPKDINDHGDVVGASVNTSTGLSTPVLWTSTGIVRLPPLLPGSDTSAWAIGNSGDVAGISTASDGNRHAVRWRSATGWRIEDLGTLGGCCSEGVGINGLGDVVGYSHVGQGRYASQHAFLANPLMTDLGSLQGSSAAWDANDFGVVVGGGDVGGTSHALLWRVP